MTDYPKRNYLEGDLAIETCGKYPKPEGEDWDKLLQEIDRADDQVLKRQAALSIAEETGGRRGWPDRSRQKAEKLIEEKRRYIEYLDKQRAEAVAAIVDAEQELNTPKPMSAAKAAVVAYKALQLQRAQDHLDELLEQKYQHIRNTWRSHYLHRLESCKQNYAEMLPAVLRCEGFRDSVSFEDTVSTLLSSIEGIREYEMLLDEDYLYDCRRLGKEPNPHIAEQYNQALADPRWLPPGYTHWLEEGEYFDFEEGRIYRYDGQTPRRELPPEPREPLWPPRSKDEPLTENTAPQDLDHFTRLAEGEFAD